MRSFRKIKKSQKIRKSRKSRKSRKTRGGVKKNTNTFFSPIPYPPGVNAPITKDSIKPDFLIESGEEAFIAPKRMPPREYTIMKFAEKANDPGVIHKYSGLEKDTADIGFTESLPSNINIRDNRVLNQTPYYINDTGQRISETNINAAAPALLEELERKNIIAQYDLSSAPKEPYNPEIKRSNEYSQFVELGGRKRRTKRAKKTKRRKSR